MVRPKYIIQLLNRQGTYWFDYIVFRDKYSATEFFSRIKKANLSEHKTKARLIEVIQYDKKEY